jgi:hypothetical protein
MSSDQSIWYRIGYALGRARSAAPSVPARTLASLAERRRTGAAPSGEKRRTTPGGRDDLLASAAVVALEKVLEGWRPRRRSGILRLLRAGASGAVAALLVELLRPILTGDPAVRSLDEATVDRLLAGAGQGLVYGAVLEPRLPGPDLLKGTLFGTAEYAMHPMGGLYRILGSRAPLRRVPGVGSLLGELDPHDRVYLEHVTFGIALALLYGESRPRSNGIVAAEDE